MGEHSYERVRISRQDRGGCLLGEPRERASHALEFVRHG